MAAKKADVVNVILHLHDFGGPVRVALLLGVHQIVRWVARYAKPKLSRLLVGNAIAIGAPSNLYQVVAAVLVHLFAHVTDCTVI